MILILFFLFLFLVPVRLVGGVPWRGRVEILVSGQWGTICDDSFDDNAAEVVCRMVGYTTGYAIGGADYGQAKGPVWLDGLTCTGREQTMSECKHEQWGLHDCNHEEDVGVWCSRGDD